MAAMDAFNCQRVFKKSSPNNKLTLYLCSRDLVIENGVIDKLHGVLCVDPDVIENKKVFSQVTLTFRYGREDEEVMGLKFCNEAVMCLAQICPPSQCVPMGRGEPNTPLQDALLQRLGPRAHAFSMELTPLAPPSVQLVPAKEYRGAPIGTSYDVRAFVADGTDSKVDKKTAVKMGIRVVQGSGGPDLLTASSLFPSRESKLMRLSPKVFKGSSSPGRRTSTQLRPPVLPEESSLGDQIEDTYSNSENVSVRKLSNVSTAVPHATVEKPFLLSEGRVLLEASLEKATYSHGEPIKVTVNVTNNSHKTVRRIKVLVVQHVDVCMFSNGKFKNVVAILTSKDECPVNPGAVVSSSYVMKPARGNTKNWIALEDSYSKSGASLASTVLCHTNSPDDRNVFAIYVSYYVKVKLSLSAMGGELSLKLPFTLQHSCREEDEEGDRTVAARDDINTDDIISEDCVIDKYKDNIPTIKCYREKSPKDSDVLQVGHISPGQEVSGTKIIVRVEDHVPPDEETNRKRRERMEKVELSPMKSQHKNEDMNLISSDNENT